MTPHNIQALLFAYAIREKIPLGLCNGMFYAIKHGLVYAVADPWGYECTARGKALVHMLCDTPLPEAKWIDPRTAEQIKA